MECKNGLVLLLQRSVVQYFENARQREIQFAIFSMMLQVESCRFRRSKDLIDDLVTLVTVQNNNP